VQRVHRQADPAHAAHAELAQRMERVERHQAVFQADVTAQLARADALLEDLVAATDNLRRRLDALERAHGTPGP